MRALIPLLRPISVHTSCKGVYRFLAKDGWALTTDYLNLDIPKHKNAAFKILTSRSSSIFLQHMAKDCGLSDFDNTEEKASTCGCVARFVTRSEDKFRKLLTSLGVEVEDNSSKARHRDWAFLLAGHPTCRVSDESLRLGHEREHVPRKRHYQLVARPLRHHERGRHVTPLHALVPRTEAERICRDRKPHSP